MSDFTLNDEKVLDRDEVLSLDSGIYTGKNCDGEDIMIFRQDGAGFTIKTLQKAKDNKWWICHDYDEAGFLECEYFEPNTDEEHVKKHIADAELLNKLKENKG